MRWRKCPEAEGTGVGTITLELDLHGYHPDDICGLPLAEIVEQAWKIGVERLQLIHGHGRNRGLTPGFVNTNTDFLDCDFAAICVRMTCCGVISSTPRLIAVIPARRP